MWPASGMRASSSTVSRRPVSGPSPPPTRCDAWGTPTSDNWLGGSTAGLMRVWRLQQRRPANVDSIRWGTRFLAAAIVPFLVVAFVILYFQAEETGRLFAWPISPSMTSFVLGCAYIG